MQKTKEEKVARFRELCENMADIYEAKNRNYGDSFTKLCNEQDLLLVLCHCIIN
mgnify:CR=1 FL=1